MPWLHQPKTTYLIPIARRVRPQLDGPRIHGALRSCTFSTLLIHGPAVVLLRTCHVSP
jgi:hypothetical protein